MSATESNLWQWLKGARKALRDELVMRRLENAVSTVDADVDGIWLTKPFDLELKAGARPKRPTTKVRHEPVKMGQVLYADAILAAGGAHGFLIQVGEGHARRIYLLHGRLGRWLMPHRTEAELAEYGVEVHTPAECIELVTDMKGPLSDDY